MERVGDLEINQDVRFQDREWKAERVGWLLLVALLIVAMLGLFGNGPLSWATSSSPDDALKVVYERFGRRGGSQELTLRASADAATNGSWQIEITRGYLASLEIATITPEPDSAETTPRGVRYTFTQAAPSATLEVIFAVTPRQLWSQSGEVRVGDKAPATVSQFFFP